MKLFAYFVGVPLYVAALLYAGNVSFMLLGSKSDMAVAGGLIVMGALLTVVCLSLKFLVKKLVSFIKEKTKKNSKETKDQTTL